MFYSVQNRLYKYTILCLNIHFYIMFRYKIIININNLILFFYFIYYIIILLLVYYTIVLE